jgi:hypothetical protein
MIFSLPNKHEGAFVIKKYLTLFLLMIGNCHGIHFLDESRDKVSFDTSNVYYFVDGDVPRGCVNVKLKNYTTNTAYYFDAGNLLGSNQFGKFFGSTPEEVKGCKVIVEDEGDLTIVSRSTKMLMNFGSIAWGEPIFLSLFDMENNLVSKKTFVPFPIVSKDDKGHRVEVSIATVNNENFTMDLEGYKEGEKIRFRSVSEGEVISHSFEFSKGQSLRLSPAVVGKSKGKCHIELATDDSLLKLDFNWGVKNTEKATKAGFEKKIGPIFEFSEKQLADLKG